MKIKETTVYVPVNVEYELPNQDKNLEFVLYGEQGKGTLHKSSFIKWDTKYWLKEQ